MAEAKKTPTKKAAKPAKVVDAEVKKPKKETTNGANQEVSNTPVQATEEHQEVAEPKTAKAGKRSVKALKETEEKVAKEERKTAKDEAPTEKTKPAIKVRTRLERRGKNYRKVAEAVDATKQYSLKEATELAIKTSPVKFDATVELHINLGVDPRQADQNIRDTIVLPAGTGKTVRVAVFADADGVTTATKAGADYAATDEFLQKLEKGDIDFDILISQPTQMAKLGKYARVLGPKGLMPNPKSGTVTNDIAKAVKEAKAGRVEYRVDSTGIVHMGVGKVSFGSEKLVQNAQAVLTSVKSNKPASVKGNYVKAIYMTTTMGPSIKIATSEM